PGTTVVGDPVGQVGVYKLVKEGQGADEKWQYNEITTISGLSDGSFSSTVSAKTGEKIILTIEKGDIDLNPEFILTFSEPVAEVAPENENRFILKEDDQTDTVDIYTQSLPTQTRVSIKPGRQLEEGKRYTLELKDYPDLAGNTISLKTFFRTKKSGVMGVISGMSDVNDTLLKGNLLFTAAGADGIKVLDVSNPAAYNALPPSIQVSGQMRGLARYGEDKLVVVGGGATSNGYIKVLDISNPENISQLKSQLLSGMVGLGTGLPAGYPHRVEVVDHFAFVTVYSYGLLIVDLEKMTAQTNNQAIVGQFIPGDEDQAFVDELEVYVKQIENPDGTTTQQWIAVILVDYYGLMLLDVTQPSYPVELSTHELLSRQRLSGLELARDYAVDIDKDGRVGEDEENDDDAIFAKDEQRDLVFFTIPSTRQVFIINIEDPASTATYGAIFVKGSGGISDIVMDEEKQVLYVTDVHRGLVLIDASFAGAYMDPGTQETRILATIETSGSSHLGLTIDKDLNIAYVGQNGKGVDVIKLGNPSLKFVYKDETDGTYKEVRKVGPYGLKEADNPDKYPEEIYVMALIPGGIGTSIKADVFSLNALGAPMVPWSDEVNTSLRNIELTRQSGDITDNEYKMFLSKKIRVTLKGKKEENDTSDNHYLQSGYFLKTQFAEESYNLFSNYLNDSDFPVILDKKQSIPADTIDREKNFIESEEEKPNSPALNPSTYANVLLHSGEFFLPTVDISIPGRGMNFALARTYRSQGIYSGPVVRFKNNVLFSVRTGREMQGVMTRHSGAMSRKNNTAVRVQDQRKRCSIFVTGHIGWGWDHTYNRRLVELYSGDILYYDGSGRRERFEAIKKLDAIDSYKAPKGWFVELLRVEDGTFRLVYSNRTIEFFDSLGRLIKIQDRNHNKMEFYYNGGGQLVAVMDTMGRMMDLEYYPFELDETGDQLKGDSGRLWKVTDFADRTVEYKYFPNGDLESVDFEGRVEQYTYYQGNGNIALAHDLDTYIDPRGNEVLKVYYDVANKDQFYPVTSQHRDDAIISYPTIGIDALVVDGNNNQKSYHHYADDHVETITEDGYVTTFTYKPNSGLLDTVTYPENNSVGYKYDTSNNKLSNSNIKEVIEKPGSRGGEEAESKSLFGYDTYFNQVNSVTSPNGLSVTNSNPDERGNFKTISTNIPGIQYQHTYDFNKFGQITSQTNIFGMSTTYKYHSEAVPGGKNSSEGGRTLDPSHGGYLREISSPLITQNFKEYDQRGN
ncbi:MAG: hypothetical protein GY940_46640, partial [bacterium]|nr:hypothetical protein [bacterium]